jgi:periodic tryptophan protein 1
MISAIAWVPRGAAKAKPAKFALSAAEAEMLAQHGLDEDDEPAGGAQGEAVVAQKPDSGAAAAQEAGGGEEEDEEEEDMEEEDMEELEEDTSGKVDKHGLPLALKMDDYDDEDDMDDHQLSMNLASQDEIRMEDLKVEMEREDDDEEEPDSDAEDDIIRPTDSVLITAHTDDDYSFCQSQVFAEDIGNIFVHHDVSLPAFPLALAWMDIAPRPPPADGQGVLQESFVAVGTFKPGIEIWNLDVMDVLEPDAILGGEAEAETLDSLKEEDAAGGSKKKKKKKKKKKAVAGLKAGSHSDAVMALSWNKEHRQILASGSADMLVKLWDVTTQVCSHTFSHHTDKVQAVQWNPTEPTILASAGFDRKAYILDGRQANPVVAQFTLPADTESMAWNPHRPTQLAVACEDGHVSFFDYAAKKTMFTVQAHRKAVSDIGFSSRVPGLMMTASGDKYVKMWDVSEAKADCVAGKAMAVGEVYAAAFNPDLPFTVAAAGSNGKTAIWEADENADIARVFKDRTLPFSSEYGGEEISAADAGIPGVATTSRGDRRARAGLTPSGDGVDNEMDMILAEEPLEDGEGGEEQEGRDWGAAAEEEEPQQKQQQTQAKKKKKKKGRT